MVDAIKRPIFFGFRLGSDIMRSEGPAKQALRKYTPHIIKSFLWFIYYRMYGQLSGSLPEIHKLNPVKEPSQILLQRIRSSDPKILKDVKIRFAEMIDYDSLTSPRPPNEIYLTYFNHGMNPQHMEDFFKFFWLGIKDTGRACRFSHKIQIGATNIIIEHFHEKHLPAIALARAMGTRFIVGCNESITGSTFNGYIDPNIKMTTSAYDNHTYSKARFDRFDLASKYFDQMWLSADHQIPAYKERYGASKVQFVPYGYVNGFGFGRGFISPPDRQFDCLFSGAMTQHRSQTIEKLRTAGLKVLAIANTASSEYIRMNHFWSSKIILHLKQNKNWKNPSTLRSAHTISNLGYMVAEKCELASELDDFIDVVETDNMVEHIKHVIDNKLYLTEPEKRLARYKDEFPASKFINDALLKMSL